ncbi:MAG: phosphate ABC transporter, permease protein PstA [Candidatus Solincola sediminis]|uniref:Phosphate transport system permease protein PstA n=1 Tax=Candidatus Solincola sediminis TaxID=1797199 RepID=A0A1F2WFE1_9ACTN|nr:MAG: phosphate ABC transporter, permease protein PstA [Candidatus Solincola sediminis]OFW57873.1 MAG: phosphate ABC transporter, permease protein PstA [Candidatus Solincola sediminis]
MGEGVRKAEERAARYDKAATWAVWSFAGVAIGILAFIIGTIFFRGITTALTPSFVFGKPQAIQAGGGIWPMIVSSFYLAFLTIAIVLPVGVGAAIYMSEFAKEGWITRLVRFGADSLSTVPSVVFGIFGMVIFVIYFGLGYSLLAGALTLTLLNIPTVMRTTEEAMAAVPHSYREASMGLGASRWETVKKIVLPSAMPGITTGTVLTVGRIVGESAAIIYTVGLFVRKIPTSPLQPAAPMAANIWHMYTEGALVSDWMRVANGEAAFLLIVVLVLNLLARLLAKVYQKKLGTKEAR